MISFSTLDLIIISSFFIAFPLIGFLSSRNQSDSAEDFLLGGRKLGIFLFVLTNVSTWYGGILGVGEFTYKYGLASWFTQGLPYYLFAFLFALFFAKKIRAASLFTIPEKLALTFSKDVGLLSAVVVFILISPAPYLLMIGNIIAIVFNIPVSLAILLGLLFTAIYLIFGGYKSDLFTDAFFFFVMFGGLMSALLTLILNFGGFSFLHNNLPAEHLSLTGGASPIFILVWFLIALWTFADPGFHQRTYAAKNGNVAVKGILISIIFWAFFDLLTNSIGLYARAILPGLKQPVNSYLFLAEKVLGSGLKGFFFTALFATILSTFNSNLFLSATTIGRDFIFVLSKQKDDKKLKQFTVYGIIISSFIALLIAYIIPSVIQIWYTLGSICIPALIILITAAYYPKFIVSSNIAKAEIIFASLSSLIWFLIKSNYKLIFPFNEIEPMIVGLVVAISIHLLGMYLKRSLIHSSNKEGIKKAG